MIVGKISRSVESGYVRHMGLSMVYALNITITDEDIKAIPADKISGRDMRNFRFANGQMSLVQI